MKKLSMALLALVIVFLFSVPIYAATGDITINENTVNVIVGLVSGTLGVGVTQLIKKKLDWSGAMGYVLAAAVDGIFTVGYFAYMALFQAQAWDWLTVGLYWVAVFAFEKLGYKITKGVGLIKTTET